MSMFIFENGNVYNFHEYLQMIAEAFQPTETDFGSNIEMNNKQFGSIANSNGAVSYYTFFQIDKLYFVLVAKKNPDSDIFEIGFGVSDRASLDISDYREERLHTTSILPLYNRIIYLMKHFTEKYNVQEVAFTYTDIKLARIYLKLITNSSFQNNMKEIGFKYKNRLGKYFYFARSDI